MKRELLLSLVAQLQSLKGNHSWVAWAKIWYKLDDKDVTAMAYYYLALLQDKEHYKQGLAELKRAHQRFPKHLLLKQFYSMAIGIMQMDRASDEIH